MESSNNNFNEEEFAVSDSTGANAASEAVQSRPDFLSLTRREQMSAVEVLLFASEEPLSAQALYDILVSNTGDEKKPSGKSTKNVASSNGVSANGAINGIEAHQDGTNAQREEFTDETVHVAYLRIEPPDGATEGEIGGMNFDDETVVKPLNKESLISSLIDDLNVELEATRRVFRVREVAREGSKGFQFATNPEHGELLASLVKSKSKKRLSKAGLETLAIIAYRQPVSKPELEVIRGVSSHEIMNRLLEKNLITIVGRSESVGKPLLYGTTDEFLRLFGLQSIADLPKPRELEELMAERADILEVAQILAPSETIDTMSNTEQSDVSGLP